MVQWASYQKTAWRFIWLFFQFNRCVMSGRRSNSNLQAVGLDRMTFHGNWNTLCGNLLPVSLLSVHNSQKLKFFCLICCCYSLIHWCLALVWKVTKIIHCSRQIFRALIGQHPVSWYRRVTKFAVAVLLQRLLYNEYFIAQDAFTISNGIWFGARTNRCPQHIVVIDAVYVRQCIISSTILSFLLFPPSLKSSAK